MRCVRVVLLLTLAVGVAGAGCSVRTQSDPESIDRRDVPFGLTDDTAPSGSDPIPALGVDSAIYLFGPDGLVPVTRRTDTAAGPRRVLRMLLNGPTDDETRLGLSTAIPTGTTLRGIRVKGRRATVDLGPEFARATVPGRVRAIAQIVFSLTQISPIAELQFELEGRRIEVPTGGGELTDRPVTRADYGPTGRLVDDPARDS